MYRHLYRSQVRYFRQFVELSQEISSFERARRWAVSTIRTPTVGVGRGRSRSGRPGPGGRAAGRRSGLLLRSHRPRGRNPQTRIVKEEVFGPVAPVMTFGVGGSSGLPSQRHPVRASGRHRHREAHARLTRRRKAGDGDGRPQPGPSRGSPPPRGPDCVPGPARTRPRQDHPHPRWSRRRPSPGSGRSR